MVNNLKMPAAYSDIYEILRNTNTPDAGSLASKRPAGCLQRYVLQTRCAPVPFSA
jgi:hypothetical protein